MKKIVFLFTLVLSLFVIAACDTTDDEVTKPTISGADAVTITIGDTFDSAAGVTASDETDGDLTSDIVISGTVDTSKPGSYDVVYTVENSAGEKATVTRVVTVEAGEGQVLEGYANGTYAYKFADSNLRATFFAAAEDYLLHNGYGGIPVFANSGFNLYADRLQLPVTSYIPVMGYGTAFATMSADDAETFGGEVGEYTYRTAIGQNPTTFNQWTYDDATSSDVISLFLDSLYTYKFNESKTGYQLVPSMALEDPKPTGLETTETGFEVAKTWTVSLRDDLEWSFHEDTDTTGFDTTIDANDFVDTFKLALDEGWFRAISGGGDFFSASQEIVGAKAYYDAKDTDEPLDWDTVGLKVVNDENGNPTKIQFDFVNDMSEWNVKYWLSDFVTTPIHMGLYEKVGSRYGTSAETTAYNGVYVLDSYEPDKLLTFSKNTDFHDADSYFYTGYKMNVIEDTEIIFQEYIAGNLEAASVTTAKYDQYKNSPSLKQVPGATTFRLMINGLGTVENQKAQFDGSEYVPEPILANQDFKTAMYFAIDREKLATEVLKTSQTQMYHFTDAYLVDAETGVPFRNTEQGKAVGSDLSPNTNGFSSEVATTYFGKAAQALVDAGVYSEDEVVEISLYIFSGSEAQALFGSFIESSFEQYFVDDTTGLTVDVKVETKEFPGIYYDYMMTGSFDLSIGGISGSTLDAASFLDVYSSDNRGGFTLNWGIDTSVAEIEVTYDNPYDETDEDVTEIWSYDAIVSALTGEVTVVNGEAAE